MFYVLSACIVAVNGNSMSVCWSVRLSNSYSAFIIIIIIIIIIIYLRTQAATKR